MDGGVSHSSPAPLRSSRRVAAWLVAWVALAGCDATAENTRAMEYVRRYQSDFRALAPSDCLPDGAQREAWTVRFAGHGCVRPEAEGARGWLALAPGAVRGAALTKAALALGPRHERAFQLSLRLVTDAQLRAEAPPNPWEAAWVAWDYTDDAHFYYLVLKPNGWEVGKRDPAYPGGQRFLVTGSAPAFPIGQWYAVTVEREDAETTVAVDGVPLASFTDDERPYAGGRIGLYTEDAAVRFSSIQLAEPVR